MKKAYLDCISGISGDMMVAALIDLGLPGELLSEEMSRLPLDGYEISHSRALKKGIDSVKFEVALKAPQKGRTYQDIRQMIETSSLGDEVKAMSLRLFSTLAEAEGTVHGVEADEVHFHEVGAVDSIVDMVGTAIGMHYLGISKVRASKIITGRGTVKTEHGVMPVPAPATAELLKGIPFASSSIEAELVTPTGAAILKEFSSSFGEMPEMIVDKIGYGAGSKDFSDRPNVLRVFLGKEEEGETLYERDSMLLMEAMIDDMNPQFFEPLVEDLFNGGCRDVVLFPAYAKKNRPGTLLQALVPPHLKEKIARVIFSGSTTIGLRFHPVERMKLKREEETLSTSFGDIKVKRVTGPDGREEIRPEYEELKKISRNSKLPIVEVSARLQKEIQNKQD